jgi:thiamine biosynthesis lipoprotein
MTGCPAFELDDASRSIRLLEPGVVLDLGAIAKGHALDVAVRVLREADVDCALLHGGTSSVHAMGAPPDSAGWGIRLAHAPQAPPRVLRNRALSVSGTTGPVAVGGSRAHLRDGRDGSIVRPDRFAMVEGHSAREADGWATAIAVLGHRPAGLDAHWYASIVEPDV